MSDLNKSSWIRPLCIVLVIIATAVVITVLLYFWIAGKNEAPSGLNDKEDQICKTQRSMKVVGVVGLVGLLFGIVGLAIHKYSAGNETKLLVPNPDNKPMLDRHKAFLQTRPKVLKCRMQSDGGGGNVSVFTKSVMGKQQVKLYTLYCEEGFSRKDVYFSLATNENSGAFMLGDVCYLENQPHKEFYSETIDTPLSGSAFDLVPTYECKQKLLEDYGKFLDYMETPHGDFAECLEKPVAEKSFHRLWIEIAKRNGLACHSERNDNLAPLQYKTDKQTKTVYCAGGPPKNTFHSYFEDLFRRPEAKFSRYMDVTLSPPQANDPWAFSQYCVFFKDFAVDGNCKMRDVELPDEA